MYPYQIAPAQGSDPADEWHRLGVEAQVSGNLPLAQQRYQQALRLDPRHALATQNLAIVFAQSNLLNEALLTIERASMMDGVHGVIKTNWSLMALNSDRIEDALSAAREAVRLAPDDTNAWMVLAMALTSAGMSQEAVPIYNRILDKEPSHVVAGPNACFIQTLTSASPEELLAQRKRWHSANGWKNKIESHKNLMEPNRVLRVGYVGGDFKSHSASFIFGRVVLHHSPAVETYLYSTLPVDENADQRTKAFKAKVGANWRDIAAMNDEDADALIRRDKIDILVDLAGHTNGGRLPLFTRKPAPVQVTAWGFAHGTGCPEIDWFFADPIAVRAEERQHYAERIYDLPCIVTMEPPLEHGLKTVSQAPVRRNGFITFGVYARFEKMSDECIQTFAEILRRVPDSKIEFKDNAYRRPYSIRRITNLMTGIAPERLLFSLATSHRDHMLAYQQADICLDPFPHGGGVVSLEQLYMGVPLVTLYGSQPSGRSGSSILANMGRHDWIGRTPAEYVEVAVRLAEDPSTAKHRLTLSDELMKSPVVEGYVEAVEAAYRTIWQEYCAR